jgi:HEAT repeat protein
LALACWLTCCAAPRHTDVLQSVLDRQDRREVADREIIGWLRHHDPRVRAWTARSLGVRADPTVVPALVQCLRDDRDGDVRSHAALALRAGFGTPAADDAVRALLHALGHDPQASVRQNSALALASAPASASVGAGLAAALHASAPGVRACAAHALAAHAGSGRAHVVHTLLDTLRRDQDATVRWCTLTALRRLGDAGAAPALSDLAVGAPRDPFAVALIAQALRALAEVGAAPQTPDIMHPDLRRVLRRHVRAAEPALAASAAAALQALVPRDPGARAADTCALLDALAAARAPGATAPIAQAAVHLHERGLQRTALARVLEAGTAGAQPPGARRLSAGIRHARG